MYRVEKKRIYKNIEHIMVIQNISSGDITSSGGNVEGSSVRMLITIPTIIIVGIVKIVQAQKDAFTIGERSSITVSD